MFRIRNKNIIAIFPLIAILVVIIVFWCLKIVGITVTSDALCELEEHTHIITCYSDGELICAKPEHTHSSECFPEISTDVETSYDWKKTFDKVTITNDVVQNLISIAGTQVGYTESSHNYEYNALTEKHNYTRYGDWYGSSFGEWNTMFVSFCLNYANINDSDSLISASAESMRCAWEEKNLYFSADKYSGSRGDVVFFDIDSDQKVDRTGITVYRSESILIVIEGNVEGAVEEVVYKNYDNVLGYGKTSKLKVKDKYLYTTEVSRYELDNTAEVTWDNAGSSGPVTNTSEFYTGLLHKHVQQDGAKLDFQVHINRKSLDIIEGVDELVIRDVMSSNLSVYWESIKLKYEKSTDVWKIDALKYTMDGETKVTLAGAVFQLLTKDNQKIKFSAVADATVPTYKVDAEGTITDITTDSNGKFEIVGLDEGTYKLHEDSAPNGYNKLATDMDIVITSLYDETNLTANYFIDGSTPATIEVENNTGGLFPVTGGIGTTIFYIVGVLLILVAVVIFISKKRMATFS